MKLKPGDTVRFLNEAIEGTVKSLLANDRVEVVDTHGFSHVSSIKNLVLIEFILDENEFKQPEVKALPKSSQDTTKMTATSSLVQSMDPDQTIYAAIRLVNELNPLTTDIELFLVNNCQLSIAYTVSEKHQDLRSGYGYGHLQPRKEKLLGMFSQDQLHRFDGFEFQFLFFDDREFRPRPPAVKSLRFSSSDFLDTNYRKLFYKKDDTILLVPLYSFESDELIDLSRLVEKYKQTVAEEERRSGLNKGKFKQEKFTVLTRQKVVDLHIEQLVKEYDNMNSSQIISYQLNYFVYEMDQAILNKLHKIVFIHGVGNGVLRSSIRDLLKRYPNIRYYDASTEKYGYGATEVEFI